MNLISARCVAILKIPDLFWLFLKNKRNYETFYFYCRKKLYIIPIHNTTYHAPFNYLKSEAAAPELFEKILGQHGEHYDTD
jgi:hypothetical protein